MARPRILDRKLMEKVARKAGKKELHAVNGMVSRTASQQGISAEAALVLLAKKYGIGASTYQRRLDADKQSQVRAALPTLFTSSSGAAKRKVKDRGTPKVPPNPRV